MLTFSILKSPSLLRSRFWDVTQRSPKTEEHCVTSQKTAAEETLESLLLVVYYYLQFLVYFYLNKLLFSSFLQFQGNFINQNTLTMLL